MKIIIVRKRLGFKFTGHVQLLASSDNPSEIFAYNGMAGNALFLDFGANDRPLILLNERASNHYQSSLIHDQNCIELHSNKSFTEFCAEMFASQFSNRDNYSLVTEATCTASVTHALQTAGINLDIDKSRSCKHLVGLFYCPTTYTTPRDMMDTLNTHKVKSLTNSSATVAFNISLETLRQRQSLQDNKQLKMAAAQLIQAIANYQVEQPAQIEHLNDVIRLTNDLLVTPEIETIKQLRHQSTQFVRSQPTAMADTITLIGLLTTAVTGVILLLSALSQDNLHDDVVLAMQINAFVCLVGIATFIGGAILSTRDATELSTAMKLFAHTVDSTKDAQYTDSLSLAETGSTGSISSIHASL